MSWKVRHQGSPQAVDNMKPSEILEGLKDGQWEPTDEVQGPQDATWVKIEDHPVFAEVAQDVEPPAAPPHDDETHLDMNALIDVCLVLLVFFILITSYAALQKVLENPKVSADKGRPIPVSKEKVDEVMLKVNVSVKDGKPVVTIGKDTTDNMDDLTEWLRGIVKSTKRTQVLLEYSGEVPHYAVVGVQDAAKGAGVFQVHILAPKDEL
jgi:biopolymer transport protein ExbD